MVYSYNTHSWERQNSVEVRDIELQDQPVSEWEGLWPMTPLSGHSQQTPRAPLEEADDASFGFEPQHFGVGLHVTTNRIGAYVVKALDPHGPAQESGLVQVPCSCPGLSFPAVFMSDGISPRFDFSPPCHVHGVFGGKGACPIVTF